MKLTFNDSSCSTPYMVDRLSDDLSRREKQLKCLERKFHIAKGYAPKKLIPRLDNGRHWGVCDCGEYFYRKMRSDLEQNPYDSDTEEKLKL